MRDLSLHADEPLAGLRRAYFDRVGYGREVSGMQRAAELVMAQEEWRVNARLALLGWLMLESTGLPADLHRNNRATYRKRAEALGVSYDDLVAEVQRSSLRLGLRPGTLLAA